MAIWFVIGRIYFNHEGCPTYYHTYTNGILNTISVYAVILDEMFKLFYILNWESWVLPGTNFICILGPEVLHHKLLGVDCVSRLSSIFQYEIAQLKLLKVHFIIFMFIYLSESIVYM